MKAWITKYALTVGIQEVEGKVSDIGGGGMFCYGNVGYGNQTAHGEDWHKTREAAVKRAEKMRVAKIAALRKSIAKLEKMTW